MAEIGFYHLTRTGADTALPSLLGRTLALGRRAMVLCGGDERVAALDTALWLCPNPDWLPHGTAASGNPDLQPIWITAADCGPEGAPNAAGFLFLLDAAESARLDRFDRVFDLFDGADDAAVQAARRRWTAAKAAGHSLTYWQQTPRGWEKKG
jgi:DNA polymerase-3 subunit chi